MSLQEDTLRRMKREASEVMEREMREVQCLTTVVDYILYASFSEAELYFIIILLVLPIGSNI